MACNATTIPESDAARHTDVPSEKGRDSCRDSVKFVAVGALRLPRLL
jgi:hypothetical protein